MLEVYLVLITIHHTPPQADQGPMISGERQIHRTVESCQREAEQVTEFMKTKGFTISTTCEKFNVVG